jgi:hypothetical protein
MLLDVTIVHLSTDAVPRESTITRFSFSFLFWSIAHAQVMHHTPDSNAPKDTIIRLNDPKKKYKKVQNLIHFALHNWTEEELQIFYASLRKHSKRDALSIAER